MIKRKKSLQAIKRKHPGISTKKAIEKLEELELKKVDILEDRLEYDPEDLYLSYSHLLNKKQAEYLFYKLQYEVYH